MLIAPVAENVCVLVKLDKDNAAVLFYTKSLPIEGNDSRLES